MKPSCRNIECDRPSAVKGLCKKCYSRKHYLKHSDPLWRRIRNPPATCTAPGCDRRYHAAGLCSMHYFRNRNHGTFKDPRDNPPCRVCGGHAPKSGYCGKCLSKASRYLINKKSPKLMASDPITLDHPCVRTFLKLIANGFDHLDPELRPSIMITLVSNVLAKYTDNPREAFEEVSPLIIEAIDAAVASRTK